MKNHILTKTRYIAICAESPHNIVSDISARPISVSDISVNVAEISDRVSKLKKKVCNVQKSVQNNRNVVDDVLY